MTPAMFDRDLFRGIALRDAVPKPGRLAIRARAVREQRDSPSC